MGKRHTIQIPSGTYHRITAIANRCDSKLYGVVAWLANGWEMLTPEQRAAAMAAGDPASPSSGDASQSDSRTAQKQRPAGATLSRRRGAA